MPVHCNGKEICVSEDMCGTTVVDDKKHWII